MRTTEAIVIVLAVLSAASALLAVEAKRLLNAIISLAVMFACIGIIYWLFLAPYVALFHLLVYGGAVVILLVTAIMFVGGEGS